MGAWGLGPFDSDSALDYLGNMVDDLGVQLDEEGLYPTDAVDPQRTADYLGVALTLPVFAEAGYYAYLENNAQRYAAAGLVAAALTPSLVPAASTSLIARMQGDHAVSHEDVLDLSSGMGYLVMLDRTTALGIRKEALAAVEALQGEQQWLQSWSDPQSLQMHLDALHQILRDA